MNYYEKLSVLNKYPDIKSLSIGLQEVYFNSRGKISEKDSLIIETSFRLLQALTEKPERQEADGEKKS